MEEEEEGVGEEIEYNDDVTPLPALRCVPRHFSSAAAPIAHHVENVRCTQRNIPRCDINNISFLFPFRSQGGISYQAPLCYLPRC